MVKLLSVSIIVTLFGIPMVQAAKAAKAAKTAVRVLRPVLQPIAKANKDFSLSEATQNPGLQAANEVTRDAIGVVAAENPEEAREEAEKTIDAAIALATETAGDASTEAATKQLHKTAVGKTLDPTVKAIIAQATETAKTAAAAAAKKEVRDWFSWR